MTVIVHGPYPNPIFRHITLAVAGHFPDLPLTPKPRGGAVPDRRIKKGYSATREPAHFHGKYTR